MNTKNMKRWVLFLPVVVIAIIFISESPLTFGFCKHIDAVTYATPYCLDGSLLPEYVSQIIAFLSLSLIFLSLLTYLAKDQVFRAWWNFARWWVPVIVVVTLLLENAGGGGSLNMGQDFTIFILVILYTIFIITSIVKIIKRYSYLKFLEQGISGDKLNELKYKTNKKIAIAVILFLTAWFLIGYLM